MRGSKPTIHALRRSGQLWHALTRARYWINHIIERQGALDDVSIRALLYMLVGSWLGKQVLRDCGTCEKMVALTFSQLERRKDSIVGELLGCDGALVAFATGILRAHGLRSTTLDNLIRAVAQTLRDSGRRGHARNSALTLPMYFLLSRLGIRSFWAKHTEFQFQVDEDYGALLRADAKDIDEVICIVYASTLYGKRKTRLSGEERDRVRSVLRIWTLHEMDLYNLVCVSALLRGMRYLGMGNDMSYCSGLDFLLTQQQPDGRFGFLGPEERALKAKDTGVDEVLEMYLPVTVGCMWTLAEAGEGKFCFYHTL